MTGSTLPNHLSASVLASRLKRGETSALDLMNACLDRIAAREPEVKAWTFLDAERAREQARRADAQRASGQSLGALHGLPIGVKDVFDTADMPSEYGSETLRGRQPDADADAVAALRRAGAIIVGKTATSEFGMYHPSPTRNPKDLSRSPGVSSAGSAAAVVDHMVPLALGTQHTASTTLPASYCGAFAFKASFGFTSMAGSNVLVPRMAHLGLLARSISDLCLFAGAFDPALAAVQPAAPVPRLGVVKGPGWKLINDDAGQAFETFIEALPTKIVEVELPVEFDQALDVAFGLLNAHLAYRFGSSPAEIIRRYCAPLQQGIEAGRIISAARYLTLDAEADRLVELASRLLVEHDALITLSAPGEAMRLEEGPGSGVMSMPWSLCGLPTVSLPLLRGGHGLPIGVQLIGARGRDGDLLRVAGWVENAACERADGAEA
ncbi:amidase [Bradyrhizobium cenepequi]|uniref:amidase n=1 Tax=Bradyrhizobium cenepequi TaxID=2821403 RepID=UPI001CE2AE04|nr:amidase [Bradyrhizobium cenepequi]